MNKLSDNEFIYMVESAIAALEKQGKFSRRDVRAGCMHLSSEGYCCIVGHMMPDNTTRKAADLYTMLETDSSIYELTRLGFKWTKQFSEEQGELLSNLQSIHDNENLFKDAIIRMKDALTGFVEESA